MHCNSDTMESAGCGDSVTPTLLSIKTESIPTTPYPVSVFRNEAIAHPRSTIVDEMPRSDVLNRTSCHTPYITHFVANYSDEIQTAEHSEYCVGDTGLAVSCGSPRGVIDKQLLSVIDDHLCYVKTADWGRIEPENKTETNSLSKSEAKSDQKSKSDCVACGRELVNFAHLLNHIERVHLKTQAKCIVCEQKIETAGEFHLHQLVHSGMDYSSKIHVCEICRKIFKAADEFKVHQNYHIWRDRYVCGYCGKDIFGRSNFQTHQRLHLGDSPFVCEICQCGFILACDLQTHRTRCRSSTEQKLENSSTHKCAVCNKAFRSLRSTLIHRRAAHRKTYPCEYCGKVFYRSKFVVVRKDSKTGNTTYLCRNCRDMLKSPDIIGRLLKAPECL